MNNVQFAALIAKRHRGVKGTPVSEHQALGWASRKYRNTPTKGYASKREATRATELRLLLAAGKISELVEQPVFVLIRNQDGERPCTYRGDFSYRDTKTGELVVEDAKGYRTAAYRIKKKLMRFVYGIVVREV